MFISVFAQYTIMREKQIFIWATEIKKENWG